MKTKKWNRKGFTLVELLVVIAIIVALAALATPAILSQQKKAAKLQALNNMRNIHAFMITFENDFGSFPDSNTARSDANLGAFAGQTSNQLLGQLIAARYTESEEIFYAKGGNAAGNKRPDSVIIPDQKILERGECGLAYVLVTGGARNGPTGLSTTDNPQIPYLLAPVANGGADAEFRPQPYDTRGAYMRIDGSGRDERLDPRTNRLKLPSSPNTLFQGGVGTVWGAGEAALTPVIVMPM